MCVVECAIPKAAEIFVFASNAPAGIVGLTMTISGPVLTSTEFQGDPECSPNLGCTSCSQGAGETNICAIYGGPGGYQVTLSAPGYQPNVLRFTAASTTTAGGCCADMAVTQTLSVVMQPAAE